MFDIMGVTTVEGIGDLITKRSRLSGSVGQHKSAIITQGLIKPEFVALRHKYYALATQLVNIWHIRTCIQARF